MKKGLGILVALMAILLIVAVVLFNKKADLRPEGYQYPNNIEKAKQLLYEMGEAHDIKRWNDIETYNVRFADEFYGFIGKQAHPFKEQKVEFSLDYRPNSRDGRLEFMTGKEKGKAWTYQSGETFCTDENGNLEKQNNQDMEFWIPTYQYFIEMPRLIQQATVVDYIGSKTVNGIESEGVIASWNTVVPQKDIDQYIIWIAVDTKRIVKAEYTVRDAYQFVSGGAYFEEYKDFDGVVLPTVFPVESNLVKDGLLHTMSILEFTPTWGGVE